MKQLIGPDVSSKKYLIAEIAYEGFLRTIRRGDHVTVTGHVGAGTGYRNEFQTKNYVPLTTQDVFLVLCRVCSFSNLGRVYSEICLYP